MKAIQDHKKGDDWNGLTIAILNDDQSPVNLTGYTVRSVFKTSPTADKSFEFSTLDQSIIIPEPLTGRLYFAGRKITAPAQKYVFDVELTDSSGFVKTIFKKESLFTWTILQDIT